MSVTTTIRLRPFDEVMIWAKTRCSDSIFCDRREIGRLLRWVPAEDWEAHGFRLADGADPQEPREWNMETVLDQFRNDLEFAFEKALHKRGLSANNMARVIRMWCYALGADDIAHSGDYPQYGLPILKAAAIHFGFPNPIGDDRGNEAKYEE